MTESDQSGFLDRILQRVTSRKLLVWIVATIALFLTILTSEHWVAISMVYIASQAAADIVSTIKFGKPS